MTIYYLKDVMARRKAYVEGQKVKTLYVPQYKNLSLEKIFVFISDLPRIEGYLPDQVDLPKVPK